MAIDSIPPDAKEDPHRADRYGLREGLVFTAEAGERGRSSFPTAEKAAGKSCVPFSFVSRDRERLLLPGIELAVAGLFFGLGRQKASMRRTEWTAASRFWVDRRRVRPNPAVWDRTTGVITGKAGRCWRRLCRNRRTRGHHPHKVFSASDHGPHSLPCFTIRSIRSQVQHGFETKRAGPPSRLPTGLFCSPTARNAPAAIRSKPGRSGQATVWRFA